MFPKDSSDSVRGAGASGLLLVVQFRVGAEKTVLIEGPTSVTLEVLGNDRRSLEPVV